MQKAIIHTTTRVIRRLSIDDAPSIALDETAIDLTSDIDIGGGFWKLDAQNNKVSATSEEIDAADVDEARVAAKRRAARLVMNTAIDDLVNTIDTLTLAQLRAKLKTYLQALKNLR